MTGFLTTLAGQILGAAPEVGPLLPPRFAPWPGIPLPAVAPRPQERLDAPAPTDRTLFPPPLIDPTGPDVDAPLPTLRQMSELRPVSGSGIMPPQQPAVEQPESGQFQPGEDPQAEAASFPPAADHRPPGVPAAPSLSDSALPPTVDESARSTMIQARADSGARGGGAVLPASAAAREAAAAEGEWGVVPSRDMLAPPPLVAEPTAPPSQPVQWPPEPGPSQYEPVQARPESGEPQARLAEVPPTAAPVIAKERQRPRQSPADQQEVASPPSDGGSQRQVSDRGARRAGQTRNEHERRNIRPPDSSTAVVKPVQLVQPQPDPDKGQPEAVETRLKPVKAEPEPAKGQIEPVEVRPKGQPEPAKARTVKMAAQPVTRTLASAPLAAQPAAPAPAPVVQREAQPAGQTVAPLAAQPVPATAPDLSVSTQVREAPTATEHTLTTIWPEPTPPAGRAAAGGREPVIVPAPGLTPGEVWSATRTTAVTSLRQPWARPNLTEPEPAPTVRVTIGRVVVRAAPADERRPARRVELPQPPVSLDEYLRGRQGDAR